MAEIAQSFGSHWLSPAYEYTHRNGRHVYDVNMRYGAGTITLHRSARGTFRCLTVEKRFPTQGFLKENSQGDESPALDCSSTPKLRRGNPDPSLSSKIILQDSGRVIQLGRTIRRAVRPLAFLMRFKPPGLAIHWPFGPLSFSSSGVKWTCISVSGWRVGT